MKIIIETIRKCVRLAARAALPCALLCAATAFGQASVGRNVRFNQFTNNAALNVTNASGGSALTIGATSSSTIGSSNVTVYPGRGMAVFPMFTFNSAGTEIAGFGFDVTYDGTNFSTTTPIWGTVAGNGTTGQRGYFLLTSSNLDNVRAISLTKATNGHGGNMFLTNVVWSVLP